MHACKEMTKESLGKREVAMLTLTKPCLDVFVKNNEGLQTIPKVGVPRRADVLIIF